MNPELLEELTRILSAVRILSPDRFVFDGREVNASIPMAAFGVGAPRAANTAVVHLQQWLYQHCYCTRFPSAVQEVTFQPQSPDGQNSLLRELSQANRSSPRWDSGWQVLRIEASGQVWARKGDYSRVLSPGEFVNYNGPGAPPRVGEMVSMFVAKESTTLQPGYYFAFGETVLGAEDFDMVRFYWHIECGGAAPLLQLISRDLNRYQVPFRFKCPVNVSMFHRQDAAVLYVNKRFYFITRELLDDWANSIAGYLRAGTPLFTLPIAEGIAVAEDPGTGESFGTSRCRMLAEAIWSAHSKSLETDGQRLEEVIDHFRRNGLNPSHLYLNPGSINQFSYSGLN